MTMAVAPSISPFEHVGEGARGRRSAVTVTLVSMPVERLRFSGVSRASTTPWSMMASRLQSWSASSM